MIALCVVTVSLYLVVGAAPLWALLYLLKLATIEETD